MPCFVKPERRALLDQRVEAARAAGKQAFEQGRVATPALDPNLQALLTGLVVGEGLPVITAWSDAWHQANASAEVV